MTLILNNVHVSVQDTAILNGVNLRIGAGETHAIMGPNGSGKSTLANVITGKPGYTLTDGEILFNNQSIHELSTDERAQLGIFLSLQYPVEIPGVTNIYFLKTALNALRKHQGLEPFDAIDFMALIEGHLATLQMEKDLLYRSVNGGFSGGEKKRNEILQMLMLNPTMAILDETDSGLDIDALRIIARGVNSIRDAQRSVLMITHYQRLLDYIEPDFVHIMWKGCIVKSGDKTLAQELEQHGYNPLIRDLIHE